MREAWVDAVLAEPHPFTLEDLEFCAKVLDTSEDQVKTIFIKASRLFLVEHPSRDDTPLYLIAADQYSHLHTLSHQDLETNKRYLTRSLLRYLRTPEGHEAATGLFGWADLQDMRRGYFNENWARALGFAPVDQHDVAGITFQRFAYRGGDAHEA